MFRSYSNPQYCSRQGAQYAHNPQAEREAGKISADAYIPSIPPEQLLRLAILHHNKNRANTYLTDDYSMGECSAEDVRLILDSRENDLIQMKNGETRESYVGLLRRICINYLRHVEISYHRIIRACGHDRLSDERYMYVKAQILRKIGQLYPWLKKTCDRLEERTFANPVRKLCKSHWERRAEREKEELLFG